MSTPQERLIKTLPEIIEHLRRKMGANMIVDSDYLYSSFPTYLKNVDPTSLKVRLKIAGFTIVDTSDISPFGWRVVAYDEPAILQEMAEELGWDN